ncbi:MAG: hypothetical protein K5770_04000 [Lachnospiraceae bacterium]|nr:hypothetical protein [Lachnospiraceae bacterium]
MATFEMALIRFGRGDFIGIEDVITSFQAQYPDKSEDLIIGYLTGFCQGQEVGTEIGLAGRELN